MTRARISSSLLAVVVAAAAACAGPQASPPPAIPVARVTPAPVVSAPPVDAGPSAVAVPDAAPTPDPTPLPGRMLPVAASEYGARLKAIGLDPKNLPRLSAMDPTKRRLVMDYIAEATGADCTDCHASEEDLKAMTPRKAVAARMWDDWSRGLAMTDGAPIFCDSCHHGALQVLDRRDTPKIAEWMKANLVGKLARKDRKKEACESCHGDPFDSTFLDKWRTLPAHGG